MSRPANAKLLSQKKSLVALKPQLINLADNIQTSFNRGLEANNIIRNKIEKLKQELASTALTNLARIDAYKKEIEEHKAQIANNHLAFATQFHKSLPKSLKFLLEMVEKEAFWQIKHPLQTQYDKNLLRTKSYIYSQLKFYQDFDGVALFKAWYCLRFLDALVSKIEMLENTSQVPSIALEAINLIDIAEKLYHNGELFFRLSNTTYQLAQQFKEAGNALHALEKSINEQKISLTKLIEADNVSKDKGWKYHFIQLLGHEWNELTHEFKFTQLQNHLDFQQNWQNKFANNQGSFRAYVAITFEFLYDLNKDETLKKIDLNTTITDFIDNLATEWLSNSHKTRAIISSI